MNVADFFKHKIFILFLLSFSCASNLSAKAKESYKYDLAVCAIFQNEAAYLREWIEFHKLTGVKHFYLYTNLSSDKFYKVLKPYIKSGEVDLFEWDYKTISDGSNWTRIQTMAYTHALNISKKEAKWLAILDTDEFLFPVETDSLSDFLLDYDDAAAVCVNWQMYGTSGIKKIGSGHLLIEDLIYRASTDYAENVHVKSIVRPIFVDSIANPHFCNFTSGHYQVTPNKEPFSGPFSPVQVDKIRINHYWTRDEDFFYNVKLGRRKKWHDNGSIERANNLNKEIDEAIFKYIPKLKQALEK